MGVDLMIQIRPVSDLRNKFPEIENMVNEGQPVYLTKNGYGAMVVMSLQHYANITSDLEILMDEADRAADTSTTRFTHDEVFMRIKAGLDVR
jgi:prevent-host-death family protein